MAQLKSTTITGDLSITGIINSSNSLNIYNNAINLHSTGLTKGTNPSGETGQELIFNDSNGIALAANRLARIYNYVGSTGENNTSIQTYNFAANGTEKTYFTLSINKNGEAASKRTYTDAKIYGAIWNDYAEYRSQLYQIEPGRVVKDLDNGQVLLAEERLIPGAQVVSDTFGFAIGETDNCKTPLAVSGRVLVYPYRDRYEYHAGMAVCSAPNGTVDIMTREEIQKYPDAIVGIVSEIPQYETWGQSSIKVNNRIWIKVK